MGTPELCLSGQDGAPSVVTGFPPTASAHHRPALRGQPLSVREAFAADHYDWWVQRIHEPRRSRYRAYRPLSRLRALGNPGIGLAVIGRWVQGPDAAVFGPSGKLGELPIIAGTWVITPKSGPCAFRFDFPPACVFCNSPLAARATAASCPGYVHNTIYTGTQRDHAGLVPERRHRGRARSPSPLYRLFRPRHRLGPDPLAYASGWPTASSPWDLFVLGNEPCMNYPGREGGWWPMALRRTCSAPARQGIRHGTVRKLARPVWSACRLKPHQASGNHESPTAGFTLVRLAYSGDGAREG